MQRGAGKQLSAFSDVACRGSFEIKRPSQRQLTSNIDRPGDRRDGYCRLSSSGKLAS
jgi:hypothetical protein